jgi:hypothetical protein
MLSDNPIFLFGFERSGTTLFSMMVGAHPDIAVPLATTGMWYRIYNQFKCNQFQSLEQLIQFISEHDRIKLWRKTLDIDRIYNDSIADDFSSVVAAFHREYARQCHKPYWANNDIATLDEMHIAHQWFPNARFVHIVRDGRDVALSNQTMPYGCGNIYECAEKWRFRVMMNLRMGALLGSDHYHLVRYESLILEPEQTLTQLCQFLNVPYSPRMLQYGQTVDERVPQEKQWLWPELKLAPQRSKIGRWQKEMTQNQRIVFEENAASLLNELGYPIYQNIPRRVSAYLLEFIYFIDRGGRMKRLLAKFGYVKKTKLERAINH